MLKIRSARTDDSDFLGWVIFTSARGHLKHGWFDVVLQRDEEFCMTTAGRLQARRCVPCGTIPYFRWLKWTASAQRPCVVLPMNLYTAPSSAAMAEASQKMDLSEEAHAQLWPRGAFILSCATSEAGAWVIENMATLPEYRGTGVAQALLNYELDRARVAGYRRAQISFFVGNQRAEHAYIKAGFRFSEEKCSPEFQSNLGVSGLRRLARDI